MMDAGYASDDDVVFEDEWETVGGPTAAFGAGAPHEAGGAAAAGGQQDGEEDAGGDITVTLENPDAAGPKRVQKTYTREQRIATALAHRTHALCLLARCIAHDVAASDPGLQAAVLSLLEPAMADEAAAAAASDDSSDVSWLGGIARWLRGTVSLTADGNDSAAAAGGATAGGGDTAAGGAGGAGVGPNGGSSSGRAAQPRGSGGGGAGGSGGCSVALEERLLGCVEGRRASAEQMNALLVALLRSLGCLVRTAWSIDAVPFKPALAEAAIMRQLSAGGGPSASGSRGRGPGRRSPSLPAPSSLAAAAAAAGEGGKAGGDLAGAEAEERPSSGRGRGRGKGRGRGRGRGAAEEASPGPGGRRGRRKSGASAASADGAGAAAEAAEGDGGGGGGAGGGGEGEAASEAAASAASARRNRGEEELQRQIEMAMAATAAAAAAAEASRGNNRDGDNAAGGVASGSGSGRPPLPGGGGGSLRQLARQQTGGGGSGAAAGRAWSSGNAAAAVVAVPRCWAEVYCGSSATGRWVPVDAAAGWWDRPEVVESGAARPQPLSYVVAVQGGAPKDVTRRYSSNYTATLRHRDDEWWGDTMRALRNPAAHLPPRLQAAVDSAVAAGAGTNTNAAAAAGPSTSAGRSAAVAAGAAAAQRAAAAAAVAGPSGGGGKRSGGGGGGGGGAAAAEAALRAKREEAELAHREAAHRADVPRTIEGFKGHALYVLKRHIGKYQALTPDAKPLGVYKCEPYYSRSDLSDLHTAERWRREHWRAVRDEEMGQPAKVVKKRAAPGAKRAAAATADLDEMATELDGQPRGAGASGEGPTTDLYGLWQTQPWEPPAAFDGRVPKNDRGNVEVPPFARALPRGTRHLRAAGAGAVCRLLGVDWAPALVGFELQGGRMVPRFDGVVVCEEHVQLVLDAAEQQRAERAAKAARARRAAAERAWLQLIRTLWRRVQMDRRLEADPNAFLAAEEAGGRAAAGGKRKRGAKAGGGSFAGGGAKRTAKEALAALEQEQQEGGGGARGGGGGSVVGALEAKRQRLAGAAAAGADGGGGGGGGAAVEEEEEPELMEGVEVEEF